MIYCVKVAGACEGMCLGSINLRRRMTIYQACCFYSVVCGIMSRKNFEGRKWHLIIKKY